MSQCPWHLTVLRHSFWSSRAACAVHVACGVAFTACNQTRDSDRFYLCLGPETQLDACNEQEQEQDHAESGLYIWATLNPQPGTSANFRPSITWTGQSEDKQRTRTDTTA